MIVVAARDPGRSLERVLRGGQGLSVLYAQTAEVIFSGDGPDILLVSQRSFSQIVCDQAVLVMSSGSCLPEKLRCSRAVAIVDSSDQTVLSEVACRHLPALTCGFAGSDTFTLSSMTTDSAVVSLQRTITAFDGACVEPFELPVALPCRIDPFSLLAGTAVFCMMGNRSPLVGSHLWKLSENYGFALKNWQ